MTQRKEIREKAQNELMHALANAILIVEETGGYGLNEGNPVLAEAMRKQAARVGRLFGYESWQGIFDSKGDRR